MKTDGLQQELSAAGNLTLEEFTAGAFAAMLEQWQKAIEKKWN